MELRYRSTDVDFSSDVVPRRFTCILNSCSGKISGTLIAPSRFEQCIMDATVTKVNSSYSLKGEQGQTYLASGKSVAIRLWQESPREHHKTPSKREYETAGYVISGHAELEIEGQTVKLEPGDSWSFKRGGTSVSNH
jgi:uncharacterized cupin superfamily protein